MPQNFNFLIDGSSLFMPTLGDVSIISEGSLYKDSSNVFPLSEDFMSKVTNALIIYNEDNVAEIVVFSVVGSGSILLNINQDIVHPFSNLNGEHNIITQSLVEAYSMAAVENYNIPPEDFYRGSSLIKFCNILPNILKVQESITKNYTEDNYLIQSEIFGKIYVTSINLNLPQYNSSGEEILNCDNFGQNDTYGNVDYTVKILTENSNLLRRSAGPETTAFIELLNSVDTAATIIDQREPYRSVKISNDSVWAKYFIMPVKTSLSPLNTDIVTYAIVAFDDKLSVFTTRLVTSTQSDSNNVRALTTNNGILGSTNDYSKVLTFNELESEDVIISGFKGFSFNTAEYEGYGGLKETAKKEWSLNSKSFDGTLDETYASDFKYYPVECGNRLLPLTSNEIINNASIGYDPLNPSISEVGLNLTDEISGNIGYFNVAYGTAHGLILMRMHSYCPIIIPPSDPDGIELHIPGGNWDYQKEDGSFPFRESGGYTPVSMVFSPDNNFLYTIVAKPDDRTEKYICVYNLSSLNAETMSVTAKIVEDPFDAGLKSVDLIEDGKILFSSNNGGEHILIRNNSDLQSSVNGISTSSNAEGYNFGVSPIKRIHNTSNTDATWKTSNTPTTYSSLLKNTVDTHVLTPKGMLDLNDIPSGLIDYGVFTPELGENWIASELILDNNGTPIILVKVEKFSNAAQVSICNMQNEILKTITLSEEDLHPTFFEEAECISVIKLSSPEQTYGILINAVKHKIYTNSWEISFATSFGQDVGMHSLRGFNRSIIATVTIDATAIDGYTIVTEFEKNSAYVDESPDNVNENNTLKSVILFPNFSVGAESTDIVLQAQTYGSIKINTLDINNSYAIVLLNTDNKKGYQTNSVVVSQPLRLSILLENLSNEDAALKLNNDNTVQSWSDTFFSSTADGIFNIYDVYSGFYNGVNTFKPLYSHSVVTHDVSFIAAFWYNHEGGRTMKVFAPNKSTLDFDRADNKHLAAELSTAAEEKLNTFLTKNGEKYLITSSEFSVNRRNIFLFLKNMDNENDFQIIKIDIGSITNYYNGGENVDGSFSTYSIPPENIIEVSPYYFNANTTLPANVSSDLVSNFIAQSDTVLTGVFKDLNHRMYLLTKDLNTLGLIVNPESIIGADTYQSAVIKSGINLSQSQPQP